MAMEKTYEVVLALVRKALEAGRSVR